MLATPNGHKKVIVLLTDGVPTFSYKVSRVQTEADGRFYGTQFTNRQDQPGSTSYISGSYNAPDQNNINKRINSTFIATIGEAMALNNVGLKYMDWAFNCKAIHELIYLNNKLKIKCVRWCQPMKMETFIMNPRIMHQTFLII